MNISHSRLTGLEADESSAMRRAEIERESATVSYGWATQSLGINLLAWCLLATLALVI